MPSLLPEPRFLSIDEVRRLHDDLVHRHGGILGERDEALLSSAVARASAGTLDGFVYSYPFGMAAAYIFGLAKNHAFLDGNKRVALSAALTFLFREGWFVDPRYTLALGKLTLGVAEGRYTQEDVARVLSGIAVRRT